MYRVGSGNAEYAESLSVRAVQPNDRLKALQNSAAFTELMMHQEELKPYPFGLVWDYYCESCGVPVQEDWFEEIQSYEKDVLARREHKNVTEIRPPQAVCTVSRAGFFIVKPFGKCYNLVCISWVFGIKNGQQKNIYGIE